MCLGLHLIILLSKVVLLIERIPLTLADKSYHGMVTSSCHLSCYLPLETTKPSHQLFNSDQNGWPKTMSELKQILVPFCTLGACSHSSLIKMAAQSCLQTEEWEVKPWMLRSNTQRLGRCAIGKAWMQLWGLVFSPQIPGKYHEGTVVYLWI